MPAAGFETLNFGSGPPWACLRAGTGRPLLLIHGSLCDARFWQGQLAPLADAGHAVLAPSLPAYYPLHTARQMRWQDDLDALATLVEQLGDTLDVAGHSRGGFLAYQLARRLPRQVRRLILAEPGGHFPEQPAAGASPTDSGQAWRNDVIALMERGDVEHAVALFVDGVSRPGTWRASPVSFRRMALDNASTLVSQLRQDTLPPYQVDEAQALAMPVLLLKGQRSLLRFQLTVDALGRHLPQAQVVQMHGAAHAMNLAHPRRFNQILADFLA